MCGKAETMIHSLTEPTLYSFVWANAVVIIQLGEAKWTHATMLAFPLGIIALCLVAFLSWCSPLQEHPGTVHCTLILAMIACRGTEMLNWVWLIVARQSEQLFERPWLLTNCNMQSLHALWPHERDTGLFISSLLKTNQKIRKVLSFVSKKEI